MRALTHFEKCLEVNKAIGCANGIATVNSNIAIAKSKYEGDRNSEESLKASEELYKMWVAKYGEKAKHEQTILAGTN